MTPRWNLYERLFMRIAHYEPDYSLFRVVRDGILRAPRIVIWAQWALYAAAIEVVLLGACTLFDALISSYQLFLLAVLPLWGVKIWHVVSYRPPRPLRREWDFLDWICDVGAWGSAGALLTLELLGGRGVDHALYVGLVMLFVLTYAWSSP